jgi:hypothetical protein
MPLPYLETEGLLFFLSGAALSRGGLAAFRAGWWRRPRLLGVSWLVVLAVKTGLAFSPATPPALLVGLQKASILLGVGAVWTLYDAEFVRRRIEPRLLRWTGFTFFIFAFHEPLQNVLMDALLARIGSGPGPSLFLYLAVPAFVIVAATGTAILLARHVRPVYLVLTGGREAPARGPDRDRVTGASPR